MVTLTGNIIVDQPVVAHFEPKSLAAKFSGDFQVISEQSKFWLFFVVFSAKILTKNEAKKSLEWPKNLSMSLDERFFWTTRQAKKISRKASNGLEWPR